MSLVIETKLVRKHGLDTYHVIVNGTLLNTFMSKEAADTKKAQVMFAWNVEHIGHVAAQRQQQAKKAV